MQMETGGRVRRQWGSMSAAAMIARRVAKCRARAARDYPFDY